MELKLKEQGWHLTDEGIKKCSAIASSTSDVKKIIGAALDLDFREIASGALPTKREDTTLPGRCVLQVQKIRNISAPKANEDSKAAPRFLQLDLSDGVTTVQALELENIPSLSTSVPPGTKIYFRAERLQLLQGFVVLRASELQVLGGRVEALVEKWELARTMQKYARSGRRMSGSSGPPPWTAFGKKMDNNVALPNERNFKSLQAAGGGDKDKDSKENEEFNAMRNVAIAEASRAGGKKVFGGGGQQIIDHNVKKILEKGYSEEDAKHALRTTNNNLERALYNLKRRQDYSKRYEDAVETSTAPPFAGKGGRGPPRDREATGGFKRNFGGTGAASAKEEAAAPKPAGNVSLFDFLTDKLPTNTDSSVAAASTTAATTSTHTYPTTSTAFTQSHKYDKNKSADTNKSSYNNSSKSNYDANSKFENNLSSSFAAHRTTPSTQRGGRGGGGGADRSERSNQQPGERDTYNTSDRSANSRYNSTRGGGRGGRGAGASSTSSAYQSNSNRTAYEEGNNQRGHFERSSNSRGSNSNFSQNSRGNRSSHERGSNIERVQQDYENKRDSQQRSGNERYNENKSYEKNRYNQRDSNMKSYAGNREQSSNNSNTTTAAIPVVAATVSSSSSNNNNNDHAARMQKLVDSTSKMKIETKNREQSAAGGGNRQQQQQRHGQRQHYNQSQQQQQYSQSQQQSLLSQQQQQQFVPPPQQFNQNFTQLPNGFTYDSSKIIGFQSKETNEIAMTLLKSQGVTAAPSSSAAATTQQQHQVPTSYVPAVSPMLQQQQHSPYGTVTAFMPTITSTAGDGWLWKIGDLCLAKYWDDGRYYEAEITAISDKTCVVFFHGYGNHEEVLKSDCLPITDANHCPINHYSQQQVAPPLSAVPAMQSNAFQRGGGGNGGGSSHRYRGERQIYVPPQKRDN